MFVSRALRLEQLVCSPACGAAVTHYKAWLSGERWQTNDAQTSTAAPTDPMASQLRQHQEQEVLQLLSQRQGREQYKEGIHNVQNLQRVGEIGGQKGPEPTRFGDWEKGGRCTDF